MDLKVVVILALACCATSSAETCSEGLSRCQNTFYQSTGDTEGVSTYFDCVSSVVCDVNSVEYTQQQSTLALLQKELRNIDSIGGGQSSAPLTAKTTSFTVMAASLFVCKMMVTRGWN